MGGTIVCGVDGSADSLGAVKVAAQFADRLGSRLILAHVAEPVHVAYAASYPLGGFGGPMATAYETESEEEAGARLLEGVAADAGLADAERRVTIGDPAEQLAELAEEEDADLIVVGSRGRGAVKAVLLGSVSHSLIGIARCPVLIVPPQEGAI
jgi:nucleotide-binding universal stress UspA family protein